MNEDTTRGESPFERRLRQDLEEVTSLADVSGTAQEIIDRSGRRNRLVGGMTVAGVAAALVLVAIIVVPRTTDTVELDLERLAPGATVATRTESVPVPTVSVPPVPPSVQLPPAAQPTGQLLAAVDGQLIITDLDGRQLEPAGWQPSGDAPIAEVVTDGETVVTWQPPCTLEAGKLSTGERIEAVGGSGCDGAGALHEASGTIMWIGGPSESATAEELTIKYVTPNVSLGGFALDGLIEVSDRVLGLQDNPVVDGTARLLIRRRLDNWDEVMALTLRQSAPESSWDVAVPRGNGDGWAPAFTHVDGFVPLDADDGQVLDAAWEFPDGDVGFGTVERIRIRGYDDDFRGSSEIGGQQVETSSVWFDADGVASVWGNAERDPMWHVTDSDGQGMTAWSGTISGGVTAAAILPGSVVFETVQSLLPDTPSVAPTPVPDESGPTTTPTERAESPQDWSREWCEDSPLVAVTTPSTIDGAPLALCEDGSRSMITDTGLAWTHPSLARRAIALAVDPTADSAAAFTVIGPHVNREGATPALSATGGIAWSVPSPDGTRIGVAESVENIEQGAISDYTFGPGEEVIHLSWARDGRWLFITTRTAQGETLAWVDDTTVPQTIDGDNGRLTPIEVPDDQRVLAVAGEVDTPGAGVLLSATAEGTVEISGVLVADGRDLPGPRLATLGTITGDVAAALVSDGAAPTITATSSLTPQADGRWVQGSDISWLVGDGQHVWHVPSLHEPTLVIEDVEGIAVDPAALGY